MIMDPCAAVLVPGLLGGVEGYLEKFKVVETCSPPDITSFVSVSPGGASSSSLSGPQTYGYVLWCPYGNGNDDRVGNSGNVKTIVCWTSSNGGDRPINGTDGLFCGSDAGTPGFRGSDNGGYIIDPAANHTGETGAAVDSRLISACIRMTYTGAMSDSQGIFGYLENVPAELVIPSASGSPTGPSVDELLSLSSHTKRLGTDSEEVIFTSDNTINQRFQTSSEGLAAMGIPGISTTSLTDASSTESPKCFGFVWAGVAAPVALNFEFLKNIEWRAKRGTNVVMSDPIVTGPSKLPVIQAAVQKAAPGYTRKTLSTAVSMAGSLAQAALTGTGGSMASFLSKTAGNYAMKGVTSYLHGQLRLK
jgi:hypothetical protein